MRNKLLGFVLVGAAIGATLAACGTEGENGAVTCTSDSSCQTGEICHPTAKICVQSCTGATDCPDSAKNCDSLTVNGVTSGKFCQCSTTALCGQGTAGDICRGEDKICAASCTSDSECGTGRSCVDGDCKTTGGNDAGTDAGTGCTPACAANQTCTNGTCTTTSCNSANAQPDTCADLAFCSGSSCAVVPAATCANATGHGTTVANGTPVIYSITNVSGFPQTNSTFCGTSNPERFKAHVKAYWSSGTFPTGGDAAIESILHYIKANGSEGPTASTIQNTTITNNGHNIEFDQNFCLPTGSTTLSMADHFQVSAGAGNVYCAQIP